MGGEVMESYKSEVTGVTFRPKARVRPWQVHINWAGVQVYVGSFSTESRAIRACDDARSALLHRKPWIISKFKKAWQSQKCRGKTEADFDAFLASSDQKPATSLPGETLHGPDDQPS